MDSYLIVIVGAALATLGFAIAVNLPHRCLPFATLVGVAGQLANQLMLDAGYGQEASAFMGGLAVGILAEIGARLYRTPSTMFTITGFIPLVPGTLAFRSVKALLDNQFVSGMVFGFRTLLIGGAIAAGIGVSATYNQLVRRRRGWQGSTNGAASAIIRPRPSEPQED